MQSAPQSVCLALQPEDAKDRGMPAPPYTYPQGVPAAGFPARQPRDHVVWSLFNFAFFNVCCLGFLALLFSFKSRDRKVVGDTESATSYGRTAKSLNIAAMVLGIVFFILFIVLLASNIEQLQHHLEQQRNSINYFQRNIGK